MTNQEFFNELERTVADFDWKQEGNKYIRGQIKDERQLFFSCPITAVYYRKTGLFIPASRYPEAADKLRLDGDFACDIVIAADNRFVSVGGERPKYRNRLIEVLGLPQEEMP